MRRRTVLAALTSGVGLAGCLGQKSMGPSQQTEPPTTTAETPTAVSHTAEGISSTFRILDSHAPTDDIATATFGDTGATVSGTMDPSGCRRPAFGSVRYNSTDGVANLMIETASRFGPTATVECGNASYDYRCILSTVEGQLTAIEVVHNYEGKENQSFNLVKG